jgi:DNA-binding MarR family transcriptional regulator
MTNATTAAGGRASADELGDRVRSAVGRMYRRFRTELTGGSLGDAALEVLTYLHKHGPQTLTHLSEQARVAPGSMSQTVNRLTSAGYAVRAPDESDRRKVLFATTDEGAALAREARAQRNEWLARRIRELSAEDHRVLTRACDILEGLAES